jgi:hypothetical protein
MTLRGQLERAEYPFGTIGYNADAAKASWATVLEFLKEERLTSARGVPPELLALAPQGGLRVGKPTFGMRRLGLPESSCVIGAIAQRTPVDQVQ